MDLSVKIIKLFHKLFINYFKHKILFSDLFSNIINFLWTSFCGTYIQYNLNFI